MSEPSAHKTNFIRNIIEEDLKNGKHTEIVTRFPPEPNGYLHIGHAKAIFLNFGLAKTYQGRCHLRFDDTNPCTEDQEYVDSIQNDVRWLGCEWGENLYYASDYFEAFYECAVHLIRTGKAYVCSLTSDQVRAYRGTLTEPGRASPDRDRSMAENLDLFERMRKGEFDEGTYSLRAKIDMASPNINLRDPALYRIRKVSHPHVGDKWCIYPMYDYAHPLSDALEGITHSLCTLEFEDHRPLYDWCVENSQLTARPRQIEFSRLNLNYTLTSKRKLKYLVEEGYVNSWNDPRMPTLSGLRRRGYTPNSLKMLCDQVGISKQDSIIDMSLLEEALRTDLNDTTPRRMAILRPLKLVIENYPEGQSETLEVSNHPKDPAMGKRPLTFAQELWIEQEDFQEIPEADFQRLAPGKSVRLLNAYVVECISVERDSAGNIAIIHVRYLPETLHGKKPDDGRSVKGFIHWLSVMDAVPAEVRLYDRLFRVENPAAEEDVAAVLNPGSLEILSGALVEPALTQALPEERFQFNRLGYFCADQEDHRSDRLVFNRIVSLKDTWKKA